MRSRRRSIFTLDTQNKWLWGSCVLALILTTVVIEVPVIAGIFGFTTISLVEYSIALALAFTIIPFVEIVKLCQRRKAAKEGYELPE